MQTRRIKLDTAEIVAKDIHGFLQLNAGRLKRIKHRLELVVDVNERLFCGRLPGRLNAERLELQAGAGRAGGWTRCGRVRNGCEERF